MSDVSNVIGMTYTAAARTLHETGEFSAFRVMDAVDRPSRPPVTFTEPGAAPRRWVLLWMDDSEAINPNVTAAEIFEIKGGEQL